MAKKEKEEKKVKKDKPKAKGSVEKEVKKKKKVKEVEEKKTKKKKKGENEGGIEDSLYAFDVDNTLDSIEKNYGLSASAFDPDEVRQSTGLLMLDIILGRGIIPGWYTVFGPEQSCKSTTATTIMTAGLNSSIPIIQYWDYEGSQQPDYLAQILETNGISFPVDEVFGVRDVKSGKWTVPPRVRFYSENIGEKFFDALAKLERNLPDKVKINGDWYFVFEDSKENRARLSGKGGGKKVDYDVNYWRKTGKLRVPAKDGTLQALIIVDSYPAMLPEKQDVDDPNSAIAVQARMFSDQLKRVKGRMKSKRIAVVGVNQLRKIPMAMYGPSEAEPCGDALKFYSDARLKMTPRTLPAGYGKGMIEEEPSVTTDGVDQYRYIHCRAIKNKLSQPYQEGWFRLWIEDANGTAKGFDPVNDTYRYLVSTGQIAASEQPTATQRNKIKFVGALDGGKKAKVLTWLEFKVLILGTKKEQAKIYAKMAVKPRNLRKWCFKQLHNKDGLEMYFENKKQLKIGKESKKKGEDSNEE